MQEKEEAKANHLTTAFFTSHQSDDPDIQAIIGRISRENEEKNFIPAFVKYAGYPIWNKSRKVVSTAVQKETNRPPVPTKILYVPFKPENDNRIGAVLVAVMYGTDTTFNMIYNWQYKGYGYDYLDHTEWNARDVFNLFASFEYLVFEHRDFLITDHNLFARGSDSLNIVATRIDSLSSSNKTSTLVTTVTDCITFKVCPKQSTITPGPIAKSSTANKLTVQPDPCSYYELCTTYYEYTGIPDNSDIGAGVGSPASGGGGGGGGSTGSAPSNWYDNPCLTNTTDPRATFCNDKPGWLAVTEEELFDPNEAQTIKVDTSITNNYPCLAALLDSMPNVNAEAQKLLHNVFGVNAKINLTFVAAPGLKGSQYPAVTFPTSADPVHLNTLTIFNDTIFINPDYIDSAAKEFMVGAIYHEAIHTFINYEFTNTCLDKLTQII